MPPPSMGWNDLAPRAVCEALHASVREAKVSMSALVQHVERDQIILWAWEPGGRRTAPAIPHQEFVSRVQRWIDGGATCPD